MKLGHTIEDSKCKYPELTDVLLKDLETWAKERGLPLVPMEQLALFAHSCFFNIKDILQCMSAYYEMKISVPEFFANRDPRLDNLQHSMKVLQSVTLPKSDPNGNRIVVHRLSDTRPGEYIFNDGVKLLMMTVDASLYTDGCSSGYIFLFDMSGVKLGHLTRLSISSVRRFFEYLQEALPVRLKGIHVLNAVWFVDKILALIKPFMKRELFDMLHLYTGEVSDVYKHIPPSCLPQDFGGDLENLEYLHAEHCQKLDKMRDYFLEEEKIFQGYTSEQDTSINSAKPESIF